MIKSSVMFSLTGIYLFLSSILFAFAQEMDDCSNARNSLEMEYCFSDKQKSAEESLEMKYQQIIGFLKNEYDGSLRSKAQNAIKDLESSQNKWEAYRSNHCIFFGGLAFGGTASSSYETMCNIRLIEYRKKELDKAYQYLANE